MAQPMNLSKPHRPIHVGVILTKGETELLDIGPVDLLNGLSRHFTENFPDELGPPGFKGGALDLKFHWVTEDGPDTPAQLTAGLRIIPTDSFDTCPPLDIVLIGAHAPTYTPTAAELSFLRRAYATSAALLAVCGGVDYARAAGLLEGRTATGPRPLLGAWREQSPGVDWVERRWVRDARGEGKLWTSGALLNGLDLVHNFARHYWGRKESGSPAAAAATAELVDFASKLGAWPDRDVEYKDVPWNI
ncbi:hypothetical protein SAMD00023353_3601040 [Rosellinia necatrix]|uniref:DJ-1/PfpI domain-containing protein n=1 Tax=Rosellinia necatrix TaxID=77044 RepID=A0A1W2TN61_ROSNE|nr:hypothetical protein SAMD00023353_3601040 [Rosellinia necatrix]